MLAALAARQHGIVDHAELIELGLTTSAIQRRVASGRLHQLYRGVYAVGHPSVSPMGRILAAVRAYGPDAVASHHTAAWILNLKPPGGPRIHVTLPSRGRRPRKGIALHQVRSFHPDDRTVADGIPVTGVARTLLDLAEVLWPRQLRRIHREAERLNLFDLRAMRGLIARSPGRKGLKPIGALLSEATVRSNWTRSEFEERFLEIVTRAGLPMPSVNLWVHGFEVDMLWPDDKLIVELDTYEFHGSRSSFESDRLRDAILKRAGYEVLRVTDLWLAGDPGGVVETIAELRREHTRAA